MDAGEPSRKWSSASVPAYRPSLAAKRLNEWGSSGGGDCWRPASVPFDRRDFEAIAECFALERECWGVFRELVEEAIPEMRKLQREFAEEN